MQIYIGMSGAACSNIAEQSERGSLKRPKKNTKSESNAHG